MKREEERRALVEHCNEKRFRGTTDDLRKEDAKFYLKQCAIEREKQLHEKRQKMEADIMEENLYAQLAMAEVKKKEAEEKMSAEIKKKAEADRLDVLKWQNDQNSTKRQQETRMQKDEKNMLNEQWKIEDEAEQHRQTQQHLINKERNLELIRHNALEKQILESEAEKERQRDRDMVEQAVARENAINNLEKQERDERRREAKELVSVYAASKADKAAEEKLLDKITQLEEEKQWRSKEAKWK